MAATTEQQLEAYLCDPDTVAALAGSYYARHFNGSDAIVTAQCRRAADRFRGEIGHHLTRQGPRTLTLDGTGTRSIQLKVLEPVLERVEVHGRTAEVAGVSRHGMIQMRDRTPRDLGCITVHLALAGLPEVPGNVRAAVETMAIMYIGQIPGIQTMTGDGFAMNPGATGTTGTREEWSNAVRAYQLGAGDRA